MSAVEARDLFPPGAEERKRGRFPVVAKHLRTLDGILFASKLEMEFYAELKQRERAGEVTKIICQPSFKVEIGGKPYCTFTPDFSFVELMPTYGYRVAELKSSGTKKDAAYRLRKLAAELAHGIRVVEIVR